MSNLKVKLKSGTREIEIEGPRSDVDEILAKWWTIPAVAGETEEPRSDVETNLNKRRRRPAAAKKNESETGASDFKPHELANEIKQLNDFPNIQTKVIQAKGDYPHKVACVLWASSNPLRPSEIGEVLLALRVKAPAPRISEALKSLSADLLPDGKAGVGGTRYMLTDKGASAFETWLRATS